MPEIDDTPRSLPQYLFREAALPFGDPTARDANADVRKRYFGKYRGTVLNSDDPQVRGRLLVEVPDVYGMLPSSWALPCVPFAGVAMGSFVRPEDGAGVWVEFEQGDPQRPIWTGCFWNEPPQVIPLAAAQTDPEVPAITIETTTGGLSLCDVPLGELGNVCLRSGAAQITLLPGEIQLRAPVVSIEAGTFTVNRVSLVVAG